MYTHTNIKKNEILPFVTMWMDLEGIMLSEIQSDMISLMCGMKKKNQANNKKKQKLTYNTDNKQTGSCQKGGCWGDEQNG